MANKLFDQVGGIIALTLKGKNQEKLLNLALSRGIYLWDVKKKDELVYLKVRNSGFDALKRLADENGFELGVLDKKGLPFYKKILKRRMGFLGGLLICIAALYLLSSFVWFLEVSGNKRVDTAKIINAASQHGLFRGAAKWNFQRREVEEAMLRDLPQITYVQVDVKGVKAKIRVVEKIFPGEEITGPCHIVAKRDGIVEEILVLKGQANVKPGQAVARGDILISGVVFPPEPYVQEEEPDIEETLPFTVRARGQVKARTWYDGYGECHLRFDKTVYTGRQLTKIFLETPWNSFLLKGKREDTYPLYEQEEAKGLIQTPLGKLGVHKLVLKEQRVETLEYKQDEAIAIARRKAMKDLRSQLNEGTKVLDSQVDILSSPGDSIVRLKIGVEVLEDISIPQPINSMEVGH